MADRPRVAKAELAALRLEGFWLDELHFGPSGREQPAPELKVSKPQVLRDADEPRRYQMRLRVSADEGGHRVDVTVSGHFLVTNDVGEEESLALVRYNCPAILYGVLRGIVAQVTALSELGRVDLPSVRLVAPAD